MQRCRWTHILPHSVNLHGQKVSQWQKCSSDGQLNITRTESALVAPPRALTRNTVPFSPASCTRNSAANCLQSINITYRGSSALTPCYFLPRESPALSGERRHAACSGVCVCVRTRAALCDLCWQRVATVQVTKPHISRGTQSASATAAPRASLASCRKLWHINWRPLRPPSRLTSLLLPLPQNADGKLTLQEFQEGSKADPSIVQALSLYDGLV